MSDCSEDCSERFVQDGVLVKQVPAAYMSHLNSIGTLYISENINSKKMFIEWKPNDITVDSDIQDQEWAVVNTVQKRIRTLSGNLPPDYKNRQVCIKISFEEFKSFRVAKQYCHLTFFDGKSECLCVFLFQHGNCEGLVIQLKALTKATASKRDKHLFIIPESTLESLQLDRSIEELHLQRTNFWKYLSVVKEHPVEATFEAFARVTDYVYKSPEQREIDKSTEEALTQSITEYESTVTNTQEDYEVIAKVAKLPIRKSFSRSQPLSLNQWKDHQYSSGVIEDVEGLKNKIFRGGLSPELRKEVWKFLLDYYPWHITELERQLMVKEKTDEYFKMKLQWRSMSEVQERHFSDYRERKSLIEKDVTRTDRTLEFYSGDNNSNLQMLNDVLMTYVMYNFDLGYVQGMSDLLSPILQLIGNEVDSFWCFVGFMSKVIRNFDIDQAGMKEQLSNLHTLLAFVDPELATYLDNHDSGNMFFCFRWLLVWFKRELNQEDVMRLWEVLWTGNPCENFHLLVCVAILETEKENMMKNEYGFTEILRHINDLNSKLDVDVMLNKAEGIYYQIKEAYHLTDNIRLLLGLPLVGTNSSFGSGDREKDLEIDEDTTESCVSEENIRISPIEAAFEKGMEYNYI